MLLTSNIMDYLIFTDLDGTLLDHDTYSFDEASMMLEYLKKNQIPLIIVTSKTFDEVVELQKKLNISSPFIIENGAGIFIPTNEKYKKISLGHEYKATLKTFEKYSQVFKMRGFNNLSVEEIATLTSLPYEKAVMAKKRTYSEPFILEDENSLQDLKDMANKDGFDVVKGGRFYHLITRGQDKANAIKELVKIYKESQNREFKTVALGDGENDITMLSSVDYPVLIKKYDGSFIDFEKENLIKTSKIGPSGWNEALKEILCK